MEFKMRFQWLTSACSILALGITLISPAAQADSRQCLGQWKLFEQQSEAFRRVGKCSSNAGVNFELESLGRIVLTKRDQTNVQELICDNNSERGVTLNMKPDPFQLELLQTNAECDWRQGVYTCAAPHEGSLFCSITKRKKQSTNENPVLTASASWRSSPFTFSYKQEILAGVKIIAPKIDQCVGQSMYNKPLPLSWIIDSGGRIQSLNVGAVNTVLVACIEDVMSDYRFPEHGFAKQYWQQVFNSL
jgi:hypothetical protein